MHGTEYVVHDNWPAFGGLTFRSDAEGSYPEERGFDPGSLQPSVSILRARYTLLSSSIDIQIPCAWDVEDGRLDNTAS